MKRYKLKQSVKDTLMILLCFALVAVFVIYAGARVEAIEKAEENEINFISNN